MKSWIKNILPLILIVFTLPLSGQTAELSESIGNEADVRTGGSSIVVTIHGTTYDAALGTDDALTQGFYAGMSGSSAWDGVLALMTTANLVITDDTIATITLPAADRYFITDNDSIVFTIPDNCISYAGDLLVGDTIVVSNLASSITYGGTIRSSVDEDDMRTASHSYILLLSNNLWRTDILDAAVLSTIKAQFSTSPAFGSIVSNLTTGDLSLSSDSTTLTITFPADATYYLTLNETTTFTPDISLLRFSESVSGGGDSFTIDNTDPVISYPDATYSEASIRSTSNTFTLTLQGDEWADPVASNLKDAFSGDTAWTNQVKDQLTFNLLDAQHLEVTIPALSNFDIAVAENITLSVSSTHLLHSSGTYAASGTLTLQPATPTVSASGTLNGTLSEGDIRTTSHAVILTLAEENWDPSIESDGTLRETLVNGLTASGAGWSDVLSAILSGDQALGRVHLSGLQVTIDIPAVSGFDISSAINIHAEVDGSLLDHTPGGISSSNFCTINPIAPSMLIGSIPAILNESNLNGAIITVKLYEDQFVDNSFSRLNFTLTPNFSNSLRISNDNDIHYVSDDSIYIELFFNGDFDVNTDFTLSIDGSQELVTTSGILTSSNFLTAIAAIEPAVSSVTIPDLPMGIGDLVPVDIYLSEDDDGNTFTLASGQIAGRTMTNLVRSSSTHYTANILIEENTTDFASGDDILVENVQLYNGTTPGNIYSATISNSHDMIDTRRPVVDLISVSGGSYHIGQTVPVVLHADGIAYKIVEDQTSVNTISADSPFISWSESGSGVYQLNYTISEGDPDVAGSIAVEVVMEDSAANYSTVFTTVSGTVPVIDATPPSIDSMVVKSTGVKRVGEDVIVWIYTNESGLAAQTGTMINNVPLSATRVSFAALASDTVYSLTYTVAAGDASVAPGNLECTVVLKDGAGNEASQENGLLSNTVEVNTILPTATIVGGDEICEGDSVRLYVYMTGSGPFDLELRIDGALLTNVSDVSSPYSFYAKPSSSSTYTVTTVYDNIGNSAPGSGSADVIVNHPTSVVITNTRDTYAYSESKVELRANVMPGVFSGDGVETSTGYFYPAWIEPDGSWHTITYTYTNTYGCISQATKPFSVIKDIANISVDSIICYNQGLTEIIADNVENDTGSFELFSASMVLQTSGLIDTNPDDNRAMIDPEQLKGGIYYIYYYFTYGKQAQSLHKQIYIDKIPSMEIIEGPADSVCIKDIQYELRGNLDNFNADAQYQFYGNGVSGNMLVGFYFTPEQAPLGPNRLTYKYISENGCSDSITEDVINRFVPDLDFTMSTTCIPSDGGEVQFNNFTTAPDSVRSWLWTFGDVNSGEKNTSEDYEPLHDYTAPGNRKIVLEAVTNLGCTTSIDSIVDFGDKPIASFNWVSDCYLDGVPVEFENNSFSELDWYSHVWSFSEEDGTVIGTQNLSTAASTSFVFPQMDNYIVELIASNLIPETGQACSDTFTATITLKPTISLADAGYYETFNSADQKGSWSKSLNTGNSFTHGVVDFIGYDADAENLSWFTNFPEPQEAEESYIVSPCFDFRSMDRPMIRLDIMRSFDLNRDGAVIEYSLNSGSTWSRIGDYNEGINWYNAFDIINKPNNNSIGWSGTGMDEADSSWVEAAHDLDVLKGETSVLFRIIYATDGGSVDRNEGFAFDNIYIGERSKKVLLEHFTNSSDPDSRLADDIVDAMAVSDSLDMLNVQYHIAYTGEDPMNLNNPAPAAARSIYYGLNSVPYAVMDGGYADNTRYNFTSLDPDEGVLQELALERPKFDLDLDVTKDASTLTVKAKVSANESTSVQKLQLLLAVVEKEITSYTGANGDVLFRNVVLAMLPNPAGTLLEEDWTLGTSVERSFSWSYKNVEDPEELMIIGFVQDYATGRIYQAVAEDGSGATAYTEHFNSLKEMLVYPNPVRDELWVDPGYVASEKLEFRIYDMTGKLVLDQTYAGGYQLYSLDVSGLPEGMYLLVQDEGGLVSGRCRIVKQK